MSKLIPKEVVEASDTGYCYVTQDEITDYVGVLNMNQELLELMHENPGKAFGALFEPQDRRYKFYWFEE